MLTTVGARTIDDNTTVQATVTNDTVYKEGSVLLAGILIVLKQNTAANNDDNDSSGGESDSDEGSSFDMETSAFLTQRIC